MLFQVMNKNAIEKQLSQEKSQVLRNNFESFFDYFNLSLTIISFAAGVERGQLEQGGGEDEPERGGAAVEDQEQLRASRGDLRCQEQRPHHHRHQHCHREGEWKDVIN